MTERDKYGEWGQFRKYVASYRYIRNHNVASVPDGVDPVNEANYIMYYLISYTSKAFTVCSIISLVPRVSPCSEEGRDCKRGYSIIASNMRTGYKAI